MDEKRRNAFIVGQSIYKLLGRQLKTGNADNLRGEFDADCERAYRELGAKSIELTINGGTVGTVSRTVRKGKPVVTGLDVTDAQALGAWVADNADEFYAQLLDYVKRTGIVPDGVEVHTEVGEDKVSWTLRGCDYEDVLANAGGMLVDQTMAYISDGE